MSITRSQVFLVVSLVVWSLVLLKLFELHQGPAVGTEIPPVIVASQSNSPSTTVAQISPVVSKPSPPPPPPPIVEQKALTGDSALHKLTVAVKAISFASNAVANLTSPSTPPPRAYPRSIEDYRVKNLPWQEFSRSPHDIGAPDYGFPSLPNSVHVCPQEVVDKLNERLSDEDLNWCKWALRADGGQVQVGKSYGKLNSRDREKYEQLNCNAVAKGDNPSCNDVRTFFDLSSLPSLC